MDNTVHNIYSQYAYYSTKIQSIWNIQYNKYSVNMEYSVQKY
jgi:hypothetical protein